MNERVKRIIGVGIICLLVGSVVVLYYNWNANKQSSNNQEILNNSAEPPAIEVYEATFKDFTYKLSKPITYSKVDENRFKLTSDTYVAIIEPIIDVESFITLYPEKYYEMLSDEGIKVAKPEKIKVGYIDVIKYEKIADDGNSALYYLNFYSSKIIFGIELHNNQDGLGEVLDILLSANVAEKAQYDYRKIETTNDLK